MSSSSRTRWSLDGMITAVNYAAASHAHTWYVIFNTTLYTAAGNQAIRRRRVVSQGAGCCLHVRLQNTIYYYILHLKREG